MKHPELILVPIFMLADWFLTIAGAIQRDKKHRDHFKVQHYELNPIWQERVAQRKWVSPKHLLLTVALSAALICLAESSGPGDAFIEGVAGWILVFYAMLLGRHICNLMVFGYLIRRPEEISGQVTMAHALALSISMYQYMVAAVPLALICIFSPSPFVIGGLVGASSMFALHMWWRRKHRKQSRRSKGREAGRSGSASVI